MERRRRASFRGELVSDGDRAEGGEAAVAYGEVVGDVGEQDCVDIFEVAGADVVGLGAEKFFGDAGPDLEGAGHVVLLHNVLDREGREDVERDAGVVAFAVAGSADDDGVFVGDAGLLRGLRDAVDVGAEGDHGLAGAPGRHEGGGDAGDAALHLEAVAFEDVGEVLGAMELLIAEFGVAEDGVDHDLAELGAGLDTGDGVFLHGDEGSRVGGGLLGDGGGREQERGEAKDAGMGELTDVHRLLRGGKLRNS